MISFVIEHLIFSQRYEGWILFSTGRFLRQGTRASSTRLVGQARAPSYFSAKKVGEAWIFLHEMRHIRQ